MKLCLHINGSHDPYLLVPTFWNEIEKQWFGFVKTPKSLRLIIGAGKDSFELQNAFNRALSEVFQEGDKVAEEVFNMFQPMSYWDETLVINKD